MEVYKEVKLDEEITEDEDFNEIDKLMKERSEIDVSKCKNKR